MTDPCPCPLCSSAQTDPVYRSANAGLVTGTETLPELTVALCRACGFVYQASAYAPGYDRLMARIYGDYKVNRLFAFPERNPKNLEALADLTRILPADAAPDLLEVGCNRGDFLYLFKETFPHANILGIEPSAQDAPPPVPILHAPFDPTLFAARFDIVVLKHVFEHLTDPRRRAADLRSVLKPGGGLYIEVPDLNRSLATGIEDFIPDHVSYFTAPSLRRALGPMHIDLLETRNFLHLFGRPDPNAPPPPADPAAIAAIADGFAAFRQTKHALTAALRDRAESGASIAFYGVSFYFARLMAELQPQLDPSRLAVIDDNLTAETEPAFGLPRLTDIDRATLVVLCSNNPAVQDRMETRLATVAPGVTVLRPWNVMRTARPCPSASS